MARERGRAGFKGQVQRIPAGGGKEQRTEAGTGLDAAARAAVPDAVCPAFGVFFAFVFERPMVAWDRLQEGRCGAESGQKASFAEPPGQS